jgi:CheY-like chemotaxis protein
MGTWSARDTRICRVEISRELAPADHTNNAPDYFSKVSAKPRLGGSWHMREDTVWATTSPLGILTVATLAAEFTIPGYNDGCWGDAGTTSRRDCLSPRCVQLLKTASVHEPALENRTYMRLPVTPFRVLVADDFAEWRLQVCRLLQAHASQWQIVGQASDGREAVEETAELQPDIVLLDVGMPNLDGIEAAKQIRKANRRIKILFLTVNNDSDIREAADDIGADGYVLKTKARAQLIPAMELAMHSVYHDLGSYL